MRTRSLTVLISVATLALLACKGGGHLDKTDLEAKVAAEATRQIGVAATAACDAAPATSGAKTHCTATFTGGGTLPMSVTQVDGSGAIRVTPDGAWLRGDLVAKDLSGELALRGEQNAAVDCGGAVIPIQTPGSVSCGIKIGGAPDPRKAKIEIDAAGAVTWDLAP
jgi:hypothetical protein